MFKKSSIFFLGFISILTFFSSFSFPSISEFIYPTDSTYVSSYYGYRELYGKQNFHNGIDFPNVEGTYVYSIMSGVVSSAGFVTGYGNCVTILHENGYKSLYAHLSEEYLVSAGDHVRQGEIIAKVGPKYLSNGILNGFTTGPHLHLSIFDSSGKTVDPFSFEFNLS